MPRRSSLRVRRIRVDDREEILPTLTTLQAARKILATRTNDRLELIAADLRAGTQQTADGVLYFADVVDHPQPKATTCQNNSTTMKSTNC